MNSSFVRGEVGVQVNVRSMPVNREVRFITYESFASVASTPSQAGAVTHAKTRVGTFPVQSTSRVALPIGSPWSPAASVVGGADAASADVSPPEAGCGTSAGGEAGPTQPDKKIAMITGVAQRRRMESPSLPPSPLKEKSLVAGWLLLGPSVFTGSPFETMSPSRDSQPEISMTALPCILNLWSVTNSE